MPKHKRATVKYLKIIAMIASLVLLNGCETLSKQECLSGSWYELGMKDGRSGKTLDLLGRHQHACVEYGVQVNESEYRAGRTQGLSSYCQPGNAFDSGLRGERYQGVCPRDIDAVFERYNDAAYQVYQQRERVKSLDNSLMSKESSLSSKKTPDDKKAHIRDEIRKLDRERQSLRDELYMMEHRLDQLMDESRRYQFHNLNY